MDPLLELDELAGKLVGDGVAEDAPRKPVSRGSTMPPENTIFMASSTVMLVSNRSSSMTKAILPEVGLGTVGI